MSADEYRSRQLRRRTAEVHAGQMPDPTTGASAPNLVMSSTFVVDEPVSFSALDQPDDPPYIYTRWDNPTLRQLEEKLAVLEEGEAAAAYASGMAATTAVLFGTLEAGDRLVISDVIYPGIAELSRDTLPRMGIQVVPVDTSDLEAVEQALGSKARLIWVETPANPILRLADIAAIANLAHTAGARLAVDSTFATPVATRPLSLGADFVIHSLTKYLGGHGDAIGGAVVSNREEISHLRTEATIHYGGVLSPFNAWLIARGMATLSLRMEAHEAGALAIAEWLEDHDAVGTVVYPGLESHPQHELARQQMENFSGMVTFQVTGGEDVAAMMMKGLEVIHYAVSLGHHRSLIYWLSTADLMATSYHLEGDQLASYRSYAGDGIFRLSVGLEDPSDLIEDLATVLG
ncbi:MAG: aminotransferase class I/II-fold pyridoxal phosphate-dependent enzyme [Acidimicrobiia bacterium]|nr:MAG: aminotransferase class I/II-fold pyridoxal phosphate-dependent enzyme [Acidimicrobiia bacterium]